MCLHVNAIKVLPVKCGLMAAGCQAEIMRMMSGFRMCMSVNTCIDCLMHAY